MLTNRRSMMAPTSQRASSYLSPIPPTPTASTTFPPTSEPHSRPSSALTSTTPTLPGHHILKVLGTVHGITTCARRDTKSFLKSSNKNGAGAVNEAQSLTLMLYQARDQAVERMVKDCVARGGNAVVGVGFGESEILGFASVSCWGTAVFVERESERGMGREERDSGLGFH